MQRAKKSTNTGYVKLQKYSTSTEKSTFSLWLVVLDRALVDVFMPCNTSLLNTWTDGVIKCQRSMFDGIQPATADDG